MKKTPKKSWTKPYLTDYGSIEKITLTSGTGKSWGTYDGVALEPASHHPSL